MNLRVTREQVNKESGKLGGGKKKSKK